MEKLITHLTILGVGAYVLAAVFNQREHFRIHPHPKDRRQNPDSPVWYHGNVQGPNGTQKRAVAIGN